jgi:hypothetical protein
MTLKAYSQQMTVLVSMAIYCGTNSRLWTAKVRQSNMMNRFHDKFILGLLKSGVHILEFVTTIVK